MTNNEMRVAIAETQGWRRLETGGWRRPDGSIENAWYGESFRLPNYPEDLNACREFENSLSTVQEWHSYVGQLVIIRDASLYRKFPTDTFRLIVASAPQRCEAFLKVKGLWKEGK